MGRALSLVPGPVRVLWRSHSILCTRANVLQLKPTCSDGLIGGVTSGGVTSGGLGHPPRTCNFRFVLSFLKFIERIVDIGQPTRVVAQAHASLFDFFHPSVRCRELHGLIWIIAVSLLVSYHFGDIMEYLWQSEFSLCHIRGDEVIRNDFPPQSNLQALKETNTAREQHGLYLALNKRFRHL